MAEGSGDMEGFRKVPGVRVVALCDVDKKVLAGGEKKSRTGTNRSRAITDIRKLLENKDIDVVTSPRRTTGIRWPRSGPCRRARTCMCEKPVSHNVWEGRQIVEAARKYSKIVPDRHAEPFQRRHPAKRSNGCRTGNLGKIKLRARPLLQARAPASARWTARSPFPPSIDYDLWCGPAPMKPLTRKQAALRLALVWTRQRRPRQPGHPPDGHRPLVPRREGALAARLQRRRAARLRGRRRDAEHPDHCTRLREGAADLRSARPAPRQTNAGQQNGQVYMGSSVGVHRPMRRRRRAGPGLLHNATAYDKDGKEIKKLAGADDHSPTSSRPSAAASTPTSTPTSSKAISPARCATPGTSPIASANKCDPEEIREEIKGRQGRRWKPSVAWRTISNERGRPG